MWKDDIYSLTIKHDSEYMRHFYFYIYLKLKELPRYCNGINYNTSESWQALAMIDTGASNSAASSRLIERIGLVSSGRSIYSHAMGEITTPLYKFDVMFPDNKEFENIGAVEFKAFDECDFLIGMNIFRQGDMAISSENGIMAFSFHTPTFNKYIDFEKI